MEENKHPLDSIDYWFSLALTALALFVYVQTLTPSLSYMSPDGNELATISYLLGLAHSPGYPVYTWLGKLFTLLPFGDIAHRVNLMSAAMGALSSGGLYLLINVFLNPRITSPMLRRAAALCSAMLFAFSLTFWSQSVIAEVYAPNIAFIALMLLALLYWEKTRRDRDFFLFATIFGLSLGTHISNLGFAPAFVVFILLTDPSTLKRPKWWLAAIAGFGIGILQFLWLPLRADTLNDRIMLERAPVTIMGMYRYTLGAFSQIKFAFPIEELPLRLVLYIDLIRNEFALSGILFGLAGLFSLLFRRTKYYFLLVLMYLVHVWFFIQYRVFDLEVFFLAVHFLWAIFIAFGIAELLGALERLTTRSRNRITPRALSFVLAAMTLLIGLIPLARNWYKSDRSNDVAVNDFYTNVWEILPENSTLITRGGVMGYDAFYWPLIYNTRPDVFLPTLPTPFPVSTTLDGLDLYSATPVGDNQKVMGPGALPPNFLPKDLWQVPVLIGAHQNQPGLLSQRGRLVLYHLTEEPPDMITNTASPTTLLNLKLGDVTLLGIDLEPESVESGGRIHLTLYWKILRLDRYGVELSIGDSILEAHELGFGNLARYYKELGICMDSVIVEDYWLVLPSTTPSGTHDLTIRLLIGGETSPIAEIIVLDEEKDMERWLKIAGES
ncbi:MAG: DUF2723 domain-containing protein [Anaerolineales bacterium]